MAKTASPSKSIQNNVFLQAPMVFVLPLLETSKRSVNAHTVLLSLNLRKILKFVTHVGS